MFGTFIPDATPEPGIPPYNVSNSQEETSSIARSFIIISNNSYIAFPLTFPPFFFHFRRPFYSQEYLMSWLTFAEVLRKRGENLCVKVWN